MVDEVMKFITEADPEVGEAIEAEAARQRRNLELIASENIVSEPVMMAMGSVLTNKYAEGYPGKRYYGGCQCVDVVESIAIERAKKLFGCDYANVQPHSGAQANMAVFIAMLKPGDTVMGMSLDHGGHLTHGSPVNFSGLYFNIVPYGVDDNGVIDYEEVERIALEAKPKLIIAGASAYAREIDFKRFREIADKGIMPHIRRHRHRSFFILNPVGNRIRCIMVDPERFDFQISYHKINIRRNRVHQIFRNLAKTLGILNFL